ncbi:hypothetical protein [uncultured Tenacibaculum sp.]|uniref:hypothetical protein n=1 Tax=uncultured Tenacibaculum sp. TaxID=174713 RepID=UPI0026380E00|nr:hypothetical protein [uncultured Tenacibaculum sp.]
MKFLKLLFFVLIIFTSCDKNAEEIEIINTIQNSSRENFFDIEATKTSDNKRIEQLMYMTSFLIGKVLVENEEARDYFYKHIANPRTTKIELIKVLDGDVIDSNPFEIAFHEQYNMYSFRAPAPPIKVADPDSFRWGGVLNMYYHQYLFEIININRWELYFPNKSSLLDNRQTLTEYFLRNDKIVCLWKINEKFKLYSDGLILNKRDKGEYLPLNFDPSKSLFFMFVLRGKSLN